MEHTRLKNDVTILVNSCDAYSDLWPAFFTLLRRYWNTDGIHIILNTESKEFSFDGLDLQCVHCVGKPYGARMIHALNQVKTEYVVNILDDFFLRKPVDNSKVNQLLEWMDGNKKIAYFSFDPYVTEFDLPCPYEGFSRICPGTRYTLTLQLAIWRTKVFKSYWNADVNPWEWEVYSDIKTCWRHGNLFYRVTAPQIFDYGFNKSGTIFGIYRGKWVMDDVGPLFEKEGITVDFDARNNAKKTIKIADNVSVAPKGRLDRIKERYRETIRLLGVESVPHLIAYDIYYHRALLAGSKIDYNFYEFTRNKTRNKYLRFFRKKLWIRRKCL